jgi:uncharacterized protein DUF5989
MDGKSGSEFEQAAADGQGRTLVREFRDFLRHNKKWWLLPLVLVLLLQALLLMLASTAAAPFIYPLF